MIALWYTCLEQSCQARGFAALTACRKTRLHLPSGRPLPTWCWPPHGAHSANLGFHLCLGNMRYCSWSMTPSRSKNVYHLKGNMNPINVGRVLPSGHILCTEDAQLMQMHQCACSALRHQRYNVCMPTVSCTVPGTSYTHETHPFAFWQAALLCLYT